MLIDGRPVDTVSAADRGLHYGDGLFETIAVFHGRPCLWQAHLDRLAEGCERLAIPMPDARVLTVEAMGLAEGVERGVLKLVVTRGSGGRGYRPPLQSSPSRILGLHPWPEYPDTYWREGVGLRWCATPLGLNPRLAGIKHCNRLEQVLARAEWDDPDIPEGLMCDIAGRVVEGTMSNLFVFTEGRLYTPRLDRCGVTGIARAQVIAAAARLGIPCAEVDLDRDAVLDADALMLSNALIGIWPVASLGERRYDAACLPRELLAEVVQQVRRP